MKQRLFLAAGLLLPICLLPDVNCTRVAVTPEPASRGQAGPTPTPLPDPFASSVRPILRTRCAPCHEPGGVMYEKLPFDHPDVVASHSAGVLKRIQAAEERAAIERWLAGQPKG